MCSHRQQRTDPAPNSAGSWNLSQGAELEWSPGDKWNVIAELPAGSVVEYKYVCLEGDGVHAIAWQTGNNNVLAVGHADSNVEVRPYSCPFPCSIMKCEIASVQLRSLTCFTGQSRDLECFTCSFWQELIIFGQEILQVSSNLPHALVA